MKTKPLTQQAVAYYRVSTDKQGIRGLGMDAQREAVKQFLQSRKLTLLGEFEEVESGKRRDGVMMGSGMTFGILL